MNIQKKWLFATLVSVSLIAMNANAAEKAAEKNASDALIGLLEKIKTFKANFNQQIRDPQGVRISQTKGEMVIRRPGKFYWKSQSPDPILVVADGKHLWTYDIDLEQVTKQDLNKALQNSPATLLAGGLSHIKQDFNISYAKSGKCQKDIDQCFLLKSSQKDSPYGDIYIGFTKDSLQEVKMHDPLGQKIQTTFTNVKINPEVNDKIFAFVPPSGIDVIQANNQ